MLMDKNAILSNKAIDALKGVYNPKYGFAEKYDLTKLDLSITSNYYDFKKFGPEIAVNIDKAITELSGLRQHVIFEFPEGTGSIILHILGIKNTAVNLDEVLTVMNGKTITEAIKNNREFCIPLFFKEEVNLNKAHKWIKHQLTQMLIDKKVGAYTDFGSDVGLLKSIYLTRKGESASFRTYREAINQIHDGNTQLSIELNPREPYGDLCEEDLQVVLNEEFGIGTFKISTFEVITDLSMDNKLRLVISLENVFPINSLIQLETISATYDNIIKPTLNDTKMYSTYLMINYDIEDRKDSFLSFVESHINKILGYKNLDLLESISVDWGKGKDILVLHIHSR